MAHEIEVNDGVMLGNNKPAWHGLGTVVAGTKKSAEALRIAKLDWLVDLEPVQLSDGTNIENTLATVRTDLAAGQPGRALGVVSPKYKVLQNAEAFAIVDDIVGEGGADIETCGSLRNGKRIWLLAMSPDKSDVMGDTIARYMLFTTGHDGKTATKCMFTPTRVVCQNTLSFAMQDAPNKVSISHIGDIKSKVNEAKRVLGMSQDYFDKHETQMRTLASKRLDDRFAAAFLWALWPDTDGVSTKPRSEGTRERVMQLYRGEQAGGHHEAVKGTAYGLLNAVGEYVDHERRVPALGGRPSDEVRFESSVMTTGATLKDEACGLLVRQLAPRDSPWIQNARLDELLGKFDLGQTKADMILEQLAV